MVDAGQRGIEISKHIAQTIGIAQAFGRGEDALDNGLSQRRRSLELRTVLLVTGRALGELTAQGILAIGRHYPVEGMARRLLTDLYLRITLYELLTEGRHTQYAAP